MKIRRNDTSLPRQVSTWAKTLSQRHRGRADRRDGPSPVRHIRDADASGKAWQQTSGNPLVGIADVRQAIALFVPRITSPSQFTEDCGSRHAAMDPLTLQRPVASQAIRRVCRVIRSWQRDDRTVGSAGVGW